MLIKLNILKLYKYPRTL